RNSSKHPRHHHLAVFIAKALERFTNGLGLPGQVDDEGGMPLDFSQDCHLTRQDGSRDKSQTHLAQLLAKARHFPRCYSEWRFGSDVTAGWPRSTRSQHEIATHGVDQLNQGAGNNLDVVGHQATDELRWPG